jgi:hypothetical protein
MVVCPGVPGGQVCACAIWSIARKEKTTDQAILTLRLSAIMILTQENSIRRGKDTQNTK